MTSERVLRVTAKAFQLMKCSQAPWGFSGPWLTPGMFPGENIASMSLLKLALCSHLVYLLHLPGCDWLLHCWRSTKAIMSKVRLQKKWVQKKKGYRESSLGMWDLISMCKQFLYIVLDLLFAAWPMRCDNVVPIKYVKISNKLKKYINNNLWCPFPLKTLLYSWWPRPQNSICEHLISVCTHNN